MPVKAPVHRPAGVAVGPDAVRQFEAERGSASARGYDRTWQKLRLQVLAQEPLCRFCALDGIVTTADVVDHIKAVRDRPDLRLDPDNLRSLCKPHHDAHTARRGRTADAASPAPGLDRWSFTEA